MTAELESLYDAFSDISVNIPYAYNVFPTDDTAPALPYVTAFVTDGNGFQADDGNYYDRMNLSLVLFTKDKDPTTEDKVRAVLKSLELSYTWTENYSPDERIYAITYNFQMNA